MTKQIPTDSENSSHTEMRARVDIALMLAAGMGRRIEPISNLKPKCLIEVGGTTLLERAITALEEAGFKELIIVTGHLAQEIEEALSRLDTSLTISTVHNSDYATTNNIYSLWLGAKELDCSFLLLESDLIFEPSALSAFRIPNKIALDRYTPGIHDGTTAQLSENGELVELIPGSATPEKRGDYKTVNISSLSKQTWFLLKEKIQACVNEDNLTIFYEIPLGELIRSRQISLAMVDFSDIWWDEIDSITDLERVNDFINLRSIKTGT